MATLNVRINQKYDTLQAWLDSAKGESPLILGKGEIAVVEIPGTATATGLTPPAIGIKIGDGTKTFAQLDWIQAVAGDVQPWAKAAKKPEYQATEIIGLEDALNGVAAQDTNTTYAFSYADGTLVIKHKEKMEEEFVDLASFDLGLDLKADLSYVNEELGKKANSADVYTKTEADGKFETIANVATLSGTVSEISGKVGVAEGKISTLEGQVATLNGEGEGSVKKAAEDAATAAVNEFATKVSDDNVVNTFKELVDWAGEHNADAVGAIVKDIEDLKDVAHSHDNADVINGITEAQVTAWDKAVQDLATEVAGRAQADQAFTAEDQRLAGLIQDNTDAIAQVASDLADVSHTHANKTVLDGIAQADVDAARSAVQSVSGIETTKTGTDVAVTGISVDLLKNGTATLVFECGTASTVL